MHSKKIKNKRMFAIRTNRKNHNNKMSSEERYFYQKAMMIVTKLIVDL